MKTSGAKGAHVFVPITLHATLDEAAAATRAIAERAAALDPDLATTAFMKENRGGRVFVDATRVGGATVVAAYSPRVRPGTPVSFPVGWDELPSVTPSDFTIHTAPAALGDADPWAERMPAPQRLPKALVEEGRTIAPGRVQAMHEGRRRARAPGMGPTVRRRPSEPRDGYSVSAIPAPGVTCSSASWGTSCATVLHTTTRGMTAPRCECAVPDVKLPRPASSTRETSRTEARSAGGGRAKPAATASRPTSGRRARASSS